MNQTIKISLLFILLLSVSLAFGKDTKNQTDNVWKNLLKNHANCVTWISATVRIEISASGQSFPPQEQKLEALGTIIAEDGLTVLSLNKVDPTNTILSRIRRPGASVQVHYTEVLILMQDGTEVPARMLLKDVDLDLAFVLPIKEEEDLTEKVAFFPAPGFKKSKSPRKSPEILDGVVSLSKLGRNLYRQSMLRRGWVNAVITKPRKYFVIDNTSPGTPVFDSAGNWLGVVVYKMEAGKPSAIVTLPVEDILEIADQVRSRNQ
ncbi:MAG: hypothetical protein CMI27_01065 [Opitutae bacterium]|nr:hypothetical protein [Opitutae bacterium]|tara:strand:- start:1564 stop:2352 length:789 start_codon:yes stop_codon:yes gene_type:complete